MENPSNKTIPAWHLVKDPLDALLDLDSNDCSFTRFQHFYEVSLASNLLCRRP